MENNKNEYIVKLEESMKELPIALQDAIVWVLNHFEFFKELCKNAEMTAEELAKYKEEAFKNRDDMMLAILCFAQVLQEAENKEKESL